MYKSATALVAAVALSTLTVSAAHAGPSAAALTALQKNAQAIEQQAQIVHKIGKKKKKIIGGSLFGLSTAAAIGYSIRQERRCRRWERRCWNGNDYACWKFESRC